MNQKEEYRRFEQEWKKENQTVATVAQICDVASWIPLALAIIQLVLNGGIQNDDQCGKLVAYFVFFSRCSRLRPF